MFLDISHIGSTCMISKFSQSFLLSGTSEDFMQQRFFTLKSSLKFSISPLEV